MLPQRGRAGSGLGRVISPMGCAQNRKGSSITHQLQQDTFAPIGGLYFDPPPTSFAFPCSPHCSASPESQRGPVFPGGQRQCPVMRSQGAFPTQSQRCRHPSPYVPSSQPALGQDRGTTAVPNGSGTRWGGGGWGAPNLPGSGDPAAPRGSGSGRWPGHMQLHGHSRSAAGSRSHGNPGDNLEGSIQREAPSCSL